MKEWYDNMNVEEKEALWKKARIESRQLRKKHQYQAKRAIMESLKFKVTEEVLVKDNLKQGQMIAVACQDAWYPGKYSFCPFYQPKINSRHANLIQSIR